MGVFISSGIGWQVGRACQQRSEFDILVIRGLYRTTCLEYEALIYREM